MDEQLQILPFIVLFLPAVSAVFQTLFILKEGKICAGISTGAVWISFLCSAFLYSIIHFGTIPNHVYGLPWISIGQFKFEFGYQIDELTLIMLVVVTFVSGLIHVFSIGYMREDKAMGRYFAGLNFFTFAMLGIVLSHNFLMLFVFWELVGLSSYLLIGHWFEKPSAADAAKKAFLTNRIGDFGFLLGIILIWGVTGSIRFDEIAAKIGRNPEVLGVYGTIACLLIFCGAVGKSAQFPLHVWLPDAMEGPTPVSALIHAATMVAAGVFMLCRVFFLFSIKPAMPESLAILGQISPLDVIAWIGAITATLSAIIAIQQNDIKRVLAFSTLSQLGYMVMAVGLMAPSPSMFHLITHAFFKALLFLCAGSVIIALHHEQDIWKMGGLKSKMPITFATFLIATLAICGIPPFSGFYSKEAILGAAFEKSRILFHISIFGSILTAFYMTRLLVVVFFGNYRDKHHEDSVKESPWVMTIPLIVLAIMTVISGLVGFDQILQKYFQVKTEVISSLVGRLLYPIKHAPTVAALGTGASLFGIILAVIIYKNKQTDPLAKLGALSIAMQKRFYFDEVYNGIIELTHDAISRFASAVDRWIISGLFIRGIHGTTELCGRLLRLCQSGNVQFYVFVLVVGTALLVYYLAKF